MLPDPSTLNTATQDEQRRGGGSGYADLAGLGDITGGTLGEVGVGVAETVGGAVEVAGAVAEVGGGLLACLAEGLGAVVGGIFSGL